MVSQDEINRLFEAASAARDNAYAPYSNYAVGAAVLSGSGNIYSGCNVENASYGAAICAERNAIGAFVNAGEKEMLVVAVCAFGEDYPFPCGICRQVMAEWGKDVIIFVFNESGSRKEFLLSKLLPEAFTLKNT